MTRRSDAKRGIRQALRKHDWLRVDVSPDLGDNCYTETYHYRGVETHRFQGIRLRLYWRVDSVVFSFPAGLIRSSYLYNTINQCIADLGYSFSCTEDLVHIFFDERGTELRVRRDTDGSFIFTSPLPTVE